MEETCPHLGAPLSHAEIEDMEDTMAIVCPWHQYDFGRSCNETGAPTLTRRSQEWIKL